MPCPEGIEAESTATGRERTATPFRETKINRSPNCSHYVWLACGELEQTLEQPRHHGIHLSAPL